MLDFDAANRYVIEQGRRSRGKLIPICLVDPRLRSRALASLRRAISLGARGIRLNPAQQAFQINDELVHDVFDLADRKGLPVTIEAGFPVYSNPLQVAEAAQTFPDVSMIMTHCGQMLASAQNSGDALEALKSSRNLYAETSGVALTGLDGFIEEVVKEMGPSRLLFGSSSPFMDPEIEMQRVTIAQISDDAQRQILSSNARKIYALEDE